MTGKAIIKTERISGKIGKVTASDRTFHILNNVFWVIVLAITLYPLYLVVIASFSDPDAIIRGEVIFMPVNPSLMGYEAVFRYKELWRSYGNSIIYTFSGTALSIVATLTAAYATSRPSFPGKKLFNLFFVFTMFFSGGLIPTFLVMRDIGMYNNPLMLILNGCVAVWNLMVARAYIQTAIPNELYEAAMLDGATHLNYFSRVVLPLCGTIVAVLCVYYGVAKWNDYFTGLVYIKGREMLPLQTILREILASLQIDTSDFLTAMADDAINIEKAMRTAQVAKYCIIVVSTGPVVILYMIMQKYFVKGVMIGSLKG